MSLDTAIPVAQAFGGIQRHGIPTLARSLVIGLPLLSAVMLLLFLLEVRRAVRALRQVPGQAPAETALSAST